MGCIMFKPDELEAMLVRIGEALPQELDIYLIGGCAMSFRGLKDTTKDVDAILLSRSELDLLGSTLKKLKFTQDTPVEDFYLSAVMVFMQGDSRIDLFVRDVCKQLVFTDRMVKRAQLYQKLGKLSVYLASNEDIFLFKAITDREKDIDDCFSLLNIGIDSRIIVDEMEQQTRAHWCFFVYEKLCLITENTGLIPSFKEEVKRICLKKRKDVPGDFLHEIKNKKKHWP